MTLVKGLGKPIRAETRILHGGLNPDVPEQYLDDIDRCSVIV